MSDDNFPNFDHNDGVWIFYRLDGASMVQKDRWDDLTGTVCYCHRAKFLLVFPYLEGPQKVGSRLKR